MAAGSTHTTDESEQLVEAARASGPQIRESIQEMEQERHLGDQPYMPSILWIGISVISIP